MTCEYVRRFPPPSTTKDNGSCFIFRDASGRALSYVHDEHEPGRRTATKPLSRDEARRIAANLAPAPELLQYQ
jgi:hypothetical protein